MSSSSDPQFSPFIALKNPDFRWMWSGQMISEAGSQMQMVAIGWHVYLLTNSPVALGLIGLIRVIPTLIFSLVGGVYADAHDRRRILFFTQSTMMVLAALLGLFTTAGWISVGLIYLLLAGISAALAFDGPAWQAIVPNLVPIGHLTNALSLNNIMRQTAQIVGPALGGFVIAWLGVEGVYWINMASFVAVLIALIQMKTPAQKSLGKSKVSLSALWEGIHFVFRSRILLSTTLLDFFSTLFGSANALLPIFAKEILMVGPQGLGILYSAQSAGAVAAGVGMSLIGNVRRQGMLVLGALTVYGAATALYGGSRWFPLSILALALVGAADTVSTIMRHNIRQLATPDHLRGRMTSVIRIFSNGGPQLGNLEAGLLAALIGAPLSVVTGGIGTLLVVAFVAWRIPSLRDFEH
jgi:MFS family permease